MLLSEEYNLRCGLNSPIIIRPEKKAYNLLFTTKKQNVLGAKSRWLLLTLKREASKGPHQYSVRWQEPIYNSSSQFHPLTTPAIVTWDEYEKHILNIALSMDDLQPVLDDISVVKWELFLFCNDDTVAQMPMSAQRQFWKVLEPSYSLAERNQHVADCINSLPKYKHLNQRWLTLANVVDDYAYWLGNIFAKVRIDPNFMEICESYI